MRTPIRALALLAILPLHAAASANLINNGSFESHRNVSGSEQPYGWTISGNMEISTVTHAHTYGATGTSPYGEAWLNINGGNRANNGVASQTFATSLGVRYRLAYAYGQFGGSRGDQKIQASITNAATSALLARQSDGNMTPSTNLANVWNRGTLEFIGTGGSVTLSFADLGSRTNSTDLMLDDVSVQAVPEPAALLALGTGAVAFVRRRKPSRRMKAL